MKSAKRVMKATFEMAERQLLKMLFVVDDLQKELEEMSPGKTIGEEGERAQIRLDCVNKATSALGETMLYLSRALLTYEKK